MSGIIRVRYRDLTSEIVDTLSPRDAESIVVGILAENARVKGEGKILSWSEFNENPDLLINKLLAKIIVGQFDGAQLSNVQQNPIAVLSIESSAAYLSTAISRELEEILHLPRPPRIVRARKLPPGASPSPAMSTNTVAVEVRPITTGKQPQTLIASLPEDDQGLRDVRIVVNVDDFQATGSTLKGGVELSRRLFLQQECIIPVVALSKPDQATETIDKDSGSTVWDTITALDVGFWGDANTGLAYIKANGFPPMQMHRATAHDFK